jgi:L-asparaginase / beta-aspartyl-peptidase
VAEKAKRARGGKARRSVTKEARAWSLAVHGGAGALPKAGLDPDNESAVRAALTAALEAGARSLAAGVSSLDVVELAVCALEDSPLFNAGKGAVFNSRGEHELEASIMDGHTLKAGAVASLRGIKNPVTLARWVMERTPHAYLVGEGAIAFAQSEGMELMAPDYFWTEQSWSALKSERLRADPGRRMRDHGTVGAVALDRQGNVAAATSTGGMTNKLAGRVGDSSVIGAGTYASNASCAVSCTGHGEYFIRVAAARDLCALVEYGGRTVRAAAEAVIHEKVERLGGVGGAIVVGRAGEIVSVFNAGVMYFGKVTHDTRAVTAIYAGEHESVE